VIGPARIRPRREGETIFGGNDWIDLDFFLPTIKDAARNQKPIAWVGWLFGLVVTALGAVPPVHWVLLGIGVGLLLGMVVHFVRSIWERRDNQRISRRPPITLPGQAQERPSEIQVRIDVPEREMPPPTGPLPSAESETT
jgi:hypothetical protein